MKAVIASFNQEKALVGAFSVISNIHVDLCLKLNSSLLQLHYEAVLLGGGDGRQLRGVEAGAQQPGLGPGYLP